MGFKDAGKPHYLGHRERLRRRFREAGPDALPDYELLELILFRAAPRRDTKPLAKALIARFGTFAEALNAPEELLREVPGIGEAAITELKLVRAGRCKDLQGQMLAWASNEGAFPKRGYDGSMRSLARADGDRQECRDRIIAPKMADNRALQDHGELPNPLATSRRDWPCTCNRAHYLAELVSP
jgi:hypothetical protein